MQKNQILLNGISAEELKADIIKGIKDLIENHSKKELQKPKYLTRKETAKLLKVDISTLHNWNKQGILKPKQIGRRIFYSLENINEAML
ncbi:helix-turn-helix domain-containing protein [Winogradskyella sp.]|jgi:DNA-binding transcriptional regulator YiaG|uniref:helix-turn-helix domain-containing protein n=1 Tax=Winogradskyella sp. TaxID=1883156 RepID=UPI0025E9C0BA|nr:helix-turn-helix domain-containing protein [Winogradskyella sp.]MCT4628809.1 helix-turn-helix domain-containing protein [Winogradskyella sp.]